MQNRFVAFITLAGGCLALLGGASRAEACSPYPAPRELELVASYPTDGGELPADREVVLIFSTGTFWAETPESPVHVFPPEGFAVWDTGGEPMPVAFELKAVKHHKWNGIGIPEEIREWKTSFTKKELILVYRFIPKTAWEAGATYRIDFLNADVSGVEDPYEGEPVWVAQALQFSAGAAAGPLAVPAGELEADFEEEYVECVKYCWDGADCYDCKGVARAIQLLRLKSYEFSVDNSTGPLIVRFHSSGSDFSNSLVPRSYIILPGEPSPLDVLYYRLGPKEGDAAGNGCEVCVTITVESIAGTILDSPDERCFQAYQIPKPDEPCDPDDWNYEEGDEPPTALHWATCEGDTVEAQPDIVADTDHSDGLPAGAADPDETASARKGGTGCSIGAATPTESFWLSVALLLLPVFLACFLPALKRRQRGNLP